MLLITTATILISLIFAPMGCLSLWNRYTYFSDGLSHTSLLAAMISVIGGISLMSSGAIVAILFAIFVFKFKKNTDSNAIILVTSSFMLSVALILSHYSPIAPEIKKFFFGNVKLISIKDLINLSFVLLVVAIFILKYRKAMILMSFNKDIAHIKNIAIKRVEFLFLLLLALCIFLSIKIVGTLLVTTILILPAISARLIAKNPVSMIVYSIVISVITNIISVVAYAYSLMPLTAIITISGVMIYLILLLYSYMYKL
ncbi:MAG: metal ABC transporter permease [Rickettsiaceae bacterium]